MANLRANKIVGIGSVGIASIVGIGSTDAGVNFDGPINLSSQGYMYFPTGNTNQRDNNGGGRGVWAGGEVLASPGTTDTIDYIELASQGNAIDFGNLSQARRKAASVSSSTRGVFAAGATPGATDVLDFITILSTGNAADFGDMSTNVSQCYGGGNDTRGLFAGGYNNVNRIEYITVASAGNVTDFGDLQTGKFDHAGFASPTRTVFGGGKTGTSTSLNSIEFVTTSTTGNASDFGDMTVATRGPAGASSNTRGLMAGDASYNGNSIEFITIATTGNAKRFGDLTVKRAEVAAGGTSNNVRAIFAGGADNPSSPYYSNIIDFVTIASEGNAIDFGDSSIPRSNVGGVSNIHGGIS